LVGDAVPAGSHKPSGREAARAAGILCDHDLSLQERSGVLRWRAAVRADDYMRLAHGNHVMGLG